MGIPKDSVIEYELALKTDKYLLFVNGTAAEVDTARSILEKTSPLNAKVHTSQMAAAGTR